MQKFAALSGFVSTNAGGDFHPGVRREPRFLTPSRRPVPNLRFVTSAGCSVQRVLSQMLKHLLHSYYSLRGAHLRRSTN